MKRIVVYRVCIIILLSALAAETSWIAYKDRQSSGTQTEEWDFDVDTELSGKFEDALENGSIEVWFQPIVDAGSGETAGAEALSRWRDGDGFVSPGVFVPVLEETGQVAALDRNAFSQACRFQKERLDAGEELFPISVNLSVVTLMREETVSEYRELYEATGLPEGCIHIEVTESLDSDKEQLVKVADGFHEAGYKVEIDDFGAGYAALGNLAVIPYDILKIDKSLVDAIGSDRGDTLIRDVLGMAEDFGMAVTAEGVETQEQAAFLRDAGCDALQGYYYAKPMPEAEFIDYLGR